MHGRRLSGDYMLYFGEQEVKWRVINESEAVVQGPDCLEVERLLQSEKNVFDIEVRYENPISGERVKVAEIKEGFKIIQH